MKKHNGMRPQDIVILLKIAAKKDTAWNMKILAQELHISASEVSESLSRSAFAGLIAKDKETLFKSAIFDFLKYGLKYVFPVKPGTIVRGIPTAYSATPLKQMLNTNEEIVWAYAGGSVRGASIDPLIPSLPQAVMEDQAFYEIMALTETLRTGKVREQQLAIEALSKRL